MPRPSKRPACLAPAASGTAAYRQQLAGSLTLAVNYLPTMTAQRPDWATSSFDESSPTEPGDLAALSEHRQQCVAASGWRAGLSSSLGRACGWVMGRMVTTLLVLSAVIGVLLMWS